MPPKWWSADKGVVVGVVLGYISAFNIDSILKRYLKLGKDITNFILTNFAKLIPLFILGFTAKMYQTGILATAIKSYLPLLIWLTGILILYYTMLFLFALASGFSINKIFSSIKYLLPAAGVAFTSGCSITTMPWTIKGAAKNLCNPALASAVIPTTTNIQQVGDCIANSFLCFLIYRHFFGYPPSIEIWMSFSFMFVLARFATAAVLGGAVFIMLPIYEKYLNFNSEMTAIIFALNVLLDPIITTCNVLGNGILCRIFEIAWQKLNKKTE